MLLFFQFDRQTIAASELIGRLSTQYRIHDLAVDEPGIKASSAAFMQINFLF